MELVATVGSVGCKESGGYVLHWDLLEEEYMSTTLLLSTRRTEREKQKVVC